MKKKEAVIEKKGVKNCARRDVTMNRAGSRTGSGKKMGEDCKKRPVSEGARRVEIKLRNLVESEQPS